MVRAVGGERKGGERDGEGGQREGESNGGEPARAVSGEWRGRSAVSARAASVMVRAVSARAASVMVRAVSARARARAMAASQRGQLAVSGEGGRR